MPPKGLFESYMLHMIDHYRVGPSDYTRLSDLPLAESRAATAARIEQPSRKFREED